MVGAVKFDVMTEEERIKKNRGCAVLVTVIAILCVIFMLLTIMFPDKLAP